MQITLIKPNMGSKRKKAYSPSDNLEPLALAILASLTPPEHTIRCFDDRIEEIDYDQPTELAALTVNTHTARRAYQIARQFRQRNVPVVMGGVHPTLLPEEAGLHADAVIIGEAENIWPQVLKDAGARALKPYYRALERPNLQGLKPCRNIYIHKPYLPVSIIEFGRGCPYTCDFCSVAAIFQGKVRYRRIHDVIEEIQESPHTYILFADDNFYAGKKAARQLLQAMIPLGKKWMAQIHLEFTRDEDFMKLMVQSGCIGVFVGLESLNPKNLQQMGKYTSMARQYKESLAKIRDHGLCLYGSFLFGYDEDTLETFQETLSFSLKERFFSAAFNHLAPYPGTPLYYRLKAEGRLLNHSWWNDPTFHYHQFSFHPRHLSPEVMALHCREIRRKFHTFPNIFRRALDLKANSRSISNLMLYLAVNIISRQEVKAKHGLTFGVQHEE